MFCLSKKIKKNQKKIKKRRKKKGKTVWNDRRVSQNKGIYWLYMTSIYQIKIRSTWFRSEITQKTQRLFAKTGKVSGVRDLYNNNFCPTPANTKAGRLSGFLQKCDLSDLTLQRFEKKWNKLRNRVFCLGSI
jgi:hypothetical protein